MKMPKCQSSFLNCIRLSETLWDVTTDHPLALHDTALCVDETPVPAELSQCVWSNCCQLRRHKREARCFLWVMSRPWSRDSTCGPPVVPFKADERSVEFCTLNKTWQEFNFHAKHIYFIVITHMELNIKQSSYFPLSLCDGIILSPNNSPEEK